jgi:NitT/TauT family transport system substrate-binding protein
MNTLFRRISTAALAGALGLGLMQTAFAADKLKVGMPAKMFLNLVEFVAEDKGFYEKEHLDVDLVHIADSSIPVRSLIAGELDLSQAGMSETLSAVDKGAPLRTIGGVHTGLHYGLWVNPESGVKDVNDLPGKKVGISSPGSLPHVVVTALMRQAGMSENQIKQVQWVSLKGSAARVNGIIAGTIDATVSAYDPKAVKSGNADILYVVSKHLPQYVMTPWDVRAETLKSKEGPIKRFIKAELLATRWVFENQDEALKIAKKHFNYSDEELKEFYAFYKNGGVWNPNGLVTAEQAKYMQELNVEANMQKTVLPAEKVLDMRLVEQVLAEIGRYQQ